MSTPLETSTHPLAIENDKDDEVSKLSIISDKEKEVVSEVFEKFRGAQLNRDRAFRYFDGRTLIEVINDCVGRFITNVDARDGIEDWQARVHVPMTAQKVDAVLGKVVAQLPVAEVVARFDDDSNKAQVVSDLYTFSEDMDNYEELMLCAVMEGVVKGTVIGYEGYEYKERKVRDITGEKDGVPTFKVSTISENKLYGSIIPLEEFYPQSVTIRRIEDMSYCFRRYQIPYSQFIDDYSCYARYDLVQGKQSNQQAAGITQQPFYKEDFISIDVEDGNVEIIFYFNRDTDEYVIIANGIWLNPLSDMSVAPIPFNHKRLPFWSVRFSTLGSDFFYGKSLVDRMSAMQDVLNVLTNMALDQSFLTIFPPILTAGIDPIEEDYMRPGRRIPVDTQGMSLDQSFMKLDLGTPSGWHQWIIEYSKRILEEASVDQTSSGQAGVGGRTTAEEIRTAAAGVAAILGVFGKLLNYGIKNKAMLRTANILQFWTDKRYPIISSVLGSKAGMFEKAFNIVSAEDTMLTGGKRGKKMIAMYGSQSDLPTAAQVKTTAKLNEMRTGQKIEIQAVTGEHIRDLIFDIKLVPNTKTNETRDIEKALTMEWARVSMGLFPQETNKEELAGELARAFKKDPAKMFNFNQQPAAQPVQEVPAEGTKPESGKPQGDMANNMVRGMQGGEAQAMQFRDISIHNDQ